MKATKGRRKQSERKTRQEDRKTGRQTRGKMSEATHDSVEVASEKKPAPTSASGSSKPKGMRKNGKNWHAPKKAFRPTAGQTSYAKRLEERKAMAVMKEKEKEMKEEKEATRQARIQAIKDRRAAKEEKERYEKLAEKMHRKRVERMRKREKRNKLLNS
ncbi:uncharacterized protein ARB_06617 [Trichophyton benhamiae CBS 112371]|uniref:rRNA-processing protein n=1 Tax=Arthroderma benhamiae (strain ATCC MYA-4681 / CBS 112371) TaxID=663331 RepID=D4AQV7_ARTBC|nr:uncharacterized protein ARB_06617 [Trichophyton benhamiae CBS 112371]EFE34851.1 hypothetical protein ARB_06617 [Trichophyton benhamiae CBS 112371]